MKGKILRIICLAQATYYLTTGVWPLVSIGTFQRITGPKTDLWLVKTTGALITVIGLVLTAAGLRRRETEPETILLAAGSALGLAAIDGYYVARRRISPVYLLDALAEIILAAGWFLGRRKK